MEKAHGPHWGGTWIPLLWDQKYERGRFVTQNSISMLDAASTYVQVGFKVFPTHTIRNGACTCGNAKDCSPGKHPIGNLAPRGVLDATDDLGVVNRWWTQMPDANIGLATGKVPTS